MRAARADTTFAWRTRTDQPSERLFLHVEDVADTLCSTASTDTHRFASADLEAVLREMEVVAVTAAFAPTTPTSAQPRRRSRRWRPISPPDRTPITELAAPLGLSPTQVTLFQRYHRLTDVRWAPDASLADLLDAALTGSNPLRGKA